MKKKYGESNLSHLYLGKSGHAFCFHLAPPVTVSGLKISPFLKTFHINMDSL